MAEDKRNPLKGGLEVDELAGGRGGGFGGRPYPQSKVAARHAGKAEAMREKLGSPENQAKREARKARFGVKGFKKGGMVDSPTPGHVGPGTTAGNRDYAK